MRPGSNSGRNCRPRTTTVIATPRVACSSQIRANRIACSRRTPGIISDTFLCLNFLWAAISTIALINQGHPMATVTSTGCFRTLPTGLLQSHVCRLLRSALLRHRRRLNIPLLIIGRYLTRIFKGPVKLIQLVFHLHHSLLHGVCLSNRSEYFILQHHGNRNFLRCLVISPHHSYSLCKDQLLSIEKLRDLVGLRGERLHNGPRLGHRLRFFGTQSCFSQRNHIFVWPTVAILILTHFLHPCLKPRLIPVVFSATTVLRITEIQGST
mmetsp:Transcript_73710/g.196409  ORF Transcript_73710/g.196409 Transcript_73710/m.196409 type:complete len:267 (+) Transcript_73710:1123-1923(+)